MMRLNEVLDGITKLCSFKTEVLENDSKHIRVQAIVSAANYFKNAVLLQIFVHDDGATHLLFTFDEIKKDLDTLELINDFNANNPLFTAYAVERLEGKMFFELHTSNICTSENDVLSYINFILNGYITNDAVINYLKGLVALATES